MCIWHPRGSKPFYSRRSELQLARNYSPTWYAGSPNSGWDQAIGVGKISLHLRNGESHTHDCFGLVNKLDVPLLLGKYFIGRFINSNHKTKKKIIPHHSLREPTLMAHKNWSAAQKSKPDICQYITGDSAMLVMFIQRERRIVTEGHQIVLKAMCETPMLVSRQVAGLKEVLSHENVAETHACMTTKEIMNVYPGHQFYIPITNFGEVRVNLPKKQIVTEVANVPKEMLHIRGKRYSYPFRPQKHKWRIRKYCALQAHTRPLKINNRTRGCHGEEWWHFQEG